MAVVRCLFGRAGLKAVQPRATLLSRRTFRWFWFGQSGSMFGDQVTTTVVPLVAVLELHARPEQMGALVAVGLLPNLVVSIPAGRWIDRVRRLRAVMIAADLTRAVTVLVVPILSIVGRLGLADLFVVEALTGTASVVFGAGYPSAVLSVSTRAEQLPAQTLLSQSRAVAQLAGPSVGGLLVQAFSGPVAMLVDSLSFVGSALSIRASLPPKRSATRPADTSPRWTGVSFLWTTSWLRAAVAATSTINFFYYLAQAVLMIYLTRTLRFSAGAVGALTALGAVGSLIGSAVAARIARRHGTWFCLFVGCVSYPAPLLLIAGAPHQLTPALIVVAAAQIGSGAGLMLLDIAVGTLFNTEVPAHLLGNVAGVRRTVNYGVRPIGAVIGGVLGSLTGVQPTLTLGLCGAAVGWSWLLTARHRPSRDANLSGCQQK